MSGDCMSVGDERVGGRDDSITGSVLERTCAVLSTSDRAIELSKEPPRPCAVGDLGGLGRGFDVTVPLDTTLGVDSAGAGRP